jgi:hypothetical protein
LIRKYVAHWGRRVARSACFSLVGVEQVSLHVAFSGVNLDVVSILWCGCLTPELFLLSNSHGTGTGSSTGGSTAARPPRAWARSRGKPRPSFERPRSVGGVASPDGAAPDREVPVDPPDREGEGDSAAAAVVVDSAVVAGAAEAFEVGVGVVEALALVAVLGDRRCPLVDRRRALAAAPRLRTVGRPGKTIECANNNAHLKLAT